MRKKIVVRKYTQKPKANKSIQQLEIDTKNYIKTFIYPPISLLKRDNHYRRSLIFLFPSIILITGFLFYNLLYKGNNLVFFAISIVVMLVTLLLIAVKNGQLISIERYRNITGKDPAEFTNIYNEVEIIKQKWFIETTQKGRAELLDYSQEMLRSWKTYKENLEKSSYDATSLKLIKNFLFPADLSRLSTLLAALLAVSATIIITLGADRNSYDFLLENYKVTALLIFLYSMLIAEAIILILILIPIISPFWNAFITAIKPNNPTERNIYRYFTDMALAAHPIEKKTEVRVISYKNWPMQDIQMPHLSLEAYSLNFTHYLSFTSLL